MGATVLGGPDRAAEQLNGLFTENVKKELRGKTKYLSTRRSNRRGENPEYVGTYYSEGAKAFTGGTLKAFLDRDPYNYCNCFASLCCYKKRKGDKDSILAVRAIAIDADYTLAEGQSETPYEEARRALELAIMEGFPRPSAVEHGRNMRLIYVFDGPYIMTGNKKKRDASFMALKRMNMCLTKWLNSFGDVIDFNATPQNVNSYMRVPGSLNIRHVYGWEKPYRDPETGIERPGIVETLCWDVELEDTGIRYDFAKLFETCMPELPAWYEPWKNKKGKKKTKKARKYLKYRKGFCLSRLADLKELQRRGYDVGYRELMCHFYHTTCMQAGLSEKEAWKETEYFNSRFKRPLTETGLALCRAYPFIGSDGKRHEGWERRYKDSTIREKLGLLDAEPDLFNGKGDVKASKKAYEERKYREAHRGHTKKEIVAFHAECVFKMRKLGYTWHRIAEEIGRCVKTVQNYLKLYDEGLRKEDARKAGEEKWYNTPGRESRSTMEGLRSHFEFLERKKAKERRKTGLDPFDIKALDDRADQKRLHEKFPNVFEAPRPTYCLA